MSVNKKQSGYSLLELSIVILVISIIIGATLSVLTKFAMKNNYELTLKKMDYIYNNISVYLRDNRSIPCPASANLMIDNNNFGFANRGASANICAGTSFINNSSASNLSIGLVPYKSLKISRDYMFDEWGSPFTYMMIQDCNCNASENATSNFSSGNCGNNSSNSALEIRDVNGNVITNQAVILIMSHGVRKHGRFALSRAARIASPSAAPSLEINNVRLNSAGNEQSFSRIFTMKNYSRLDFDQILFYKTKAELIKDAGLREQDTHPICLLQRNFLSNISTAELKSICGSISSVTTCETMLRNMAQQVKDFCL